MGITIINDKGGKRTDIGFLVTDNLAHVKKGNKYWTDEYGIKIKCDNKGDTSFKKCNGCDYAKFDDGGIRCDR